MLPYPDIDPYFINTAFFKVRWYGLMYGLILLCSYILAVIQIKQKGLKIETTDRLRSCLYIGVGMFAGARLGHVFFYNLTRFLSAPLSIFATWQGGMASHGAFIGVSAAVFLCVKTGGFYKRTEAGFLQCMDIIVPAMPLGVGLVRVGNFINGELYGRASDLPWAMIFPNGGSAPRHPSQIYQFLLEGVILFIVLWFTKEKIKIKGGLFCLFLACHGVFRFFLEFFKAPEIDHGLIYGLSRGQVLSLATLFSGLIVYFIIQKKASNDKLNSSKR